MKAHPFLDFEIRDEDTGDLRQVRDELRQVTQIPCQGCGEHRLFTDAELDEADSIDFAFFCDRCRPASLRLLELGFF